MVRAAFWCEIVWRHQEPKKKKNLTNLPGLFLGEYMSYFCFLPSDPMQLQKSLLFLVSQQLSGLLQPCLKNGTKYQDKLSLGFTLFLDVRSSNMHCFKGNCPVSSGVCVKERKCLCMCAHVCMNMCKIVCMCVQVHTCASIVNVYVHVSVSVCIAHVCVHVCSICECGGVCSQMSSSLYSQSSGWKLF